MNERKPRRLREARSPAATVYLQAIPQYYTFPLPTTHHAPMDKSDCREIKKVRRLPYLLYIGARG